MLMRATGLTAVTLSLAGAVTAQVEAERVDPVDAAVQLIPKALTDGPIVDGDSRRESTTDALAWAGNVDADHRFVKGFSRNVDGALRFDLRSAHGGPTITGVALRLRSKQLGAAWLAFQKKRIEGREREAGLLGVEARVVVDQVEDAVRQRWMVTRGGWAVALEVRGAARKELDVEAVRRSVRELFVALEHDPDHERKLTLLVRRGENGKTEWVIGERVVRVDRDLGAAFDDLARSPDGYTIDEGRIARRELDIQADPGAPFDAIKPLMTTAAERGFRSLSVSIKRRPAAE